MSIKSNIANFINNNASIEDAYILLMADEKDICKILEDSHDGEPADYIIESSIELFTKSLNENGLDAVAKEVFAIQSDDRYCDITDIFERVRDYWFNLESLTDGGAVEEIYVRCAEFLGLYGDKNNEPIEVNQYRISVEDDYKMRLWGAWGLRFMNTSESNKLLEKLASDPYVDDSGCYLVREAAGFYED
jgi:hypothetical protein